MLELFIIGGDNNTKPDNNAKPDNKTNLLHTIYCIISIIFSIWIASLAWNKNKTESVLYRYMITILAFIFSTIYGLYYFIKYEMK